MKRKFLYLFFLFTLIISKLNSFGQQKIDKEYYIEINNIKDKKVISEIENLVKSNSKVVFFCSYRSRQTFFILKTNLTFTKQEFDNQLKSLGLHSSLFEEKSFTAKELYLKIRGKKETYKKFKKKF